MFRVIDKSDRTFTADQEFACLSSTSSTFDSIGKNSEDDEGGENEIESAYKGPLDMMESLEEALPIKRGISKFYKGKSKSFTSLSETASLPVKDLTKLENPYSRRRRNLLSHRIRSRGGISKKPVKSVLAVAVMAIRQREGDSSSSSGDDSLPPPGKYHKNLPRQRKGSLEAFTFQDKSEKDEDRKKATKGATKPVNPIGIKPGQALVTVQRQGNGHDQE
ncbi:unnamed protein product [Arabidopsis lyrata]|uniref:Predicted protein n=1 Tax=Arabidopsis lyrata subsp. lyrata TaxID=81972 RepID=D7LME6_ARALL|nr:predicted protein [Arabidopsis lyrata subsp. lyrata]CAH8267338.1 unnamed protein product [Arabidopsis lyrata]